MRDFIILLIGINAGLGIGVVISAELRNKLADYFDIPADQRW